MSAADAPHRGLLVDFGGVLTSNVFAAFAAFAQAEGLAPEAVAESFRRDREARGLLKDLESGAIDTAAFAGPFAAKLGLAPERADGLVTRMFAALRPDEAMVAAVRRARAAGIRTALVSNSWGDGMRYDEGLLRDGFDAVVLSHELRIRKPDPGMFLAATERLACRRRPASSSTTCRSTWSRQPLSAWRRCCTGTRRARCRGWRPCWACRCAERRTAGRRRPPRRRGQSRAPRP